MQGLPQELVDCIIDYVGDYTTLSACSTVCRGWTFFSQANMLRKGIQLDLRDLSIDMLVSLHDCLQHHPPLRRHLIDFEIRHVCRRIPSEWEDYLAGILNFASHLKRFSLRTVRWCFLPVKIHHAIAFVLQLPTFRRLDLKSVVTPDCATLTRLLSLPKHLDSLQLRSVTWSSAIAHATKDAENPLTEVRCLKKLTVITADMSGILEWLLAEQPSIRLSSLRRLQLSNACDPSSLAQLLALTSDTLEHLILEPIYTFHEPMVGPHLSNLPKLLHLELAGTYHFLLPLMTNAFRGLANDHPLKTVKIQAEQTSWSEDWTQIDELLSQGVLKALTSVEFWAAVRTQKQDEAGSNTFLMQFPALQTRGLCSLTFYGRCPPLQL